MVENNDEAYEEVTDSMTEQPTTDSAASETEETVPDKKVAAGTAGAVLGMLVGGPIGCALLGFGAAYASEKDDAVGDAARSLGNFAIQTQRKATEVEAEHKVVDRSKQAVTGAWENAKEYDQKFNILEKTKDGAVTGWGSFVAFVQERRLLEKGVEKVGVGYEFFAKRIGGERTRRANERAPPMSSAQAY